jgi:hypothetical protein
MPDRTTRMLNQIELLSLRINAAAKGCVIIDFAGDSLVIRLTEIIESRPGGVATDHTADGPRPSHCITPKAG